MTRAIWFAARCALVLAVMILTAGTVLTLFVIGFVFLEAATFR